MSIKGSDYARSYSEAIDGSATNITDKGQADDHEITGATMLKWFTDAYRAQERFREKTVDSLKMLNNDQWPEDLMSKLPDNMAPVVINMMLMPVLFVSGVERQTRQEAKIVAASGGDPRQAELMNALVHWVEGINMAEEIDSQVFLDKIATGLGWWKWGMRYDTRELEGSPELLRRKTLAVFPDPNFFDTRWEDARFVFDTQFMPIDEACTRWPEYAQEFKTQSGEWLRSVYGGEGGVGVATSGENSGDSFSAERLFWDDATKQVRIAECWYKRTKMQMVAVNIQHPDQVFMDEDELQQIRAAVKAQPELQSEWLMFKKPITSVEVAWLFHDKVLERDITPYEENLQEFPLFPAIGFYFWKEPFGLAELMKDLQREKNKRRSKLIELVGRMPNSGFLNKESGGANQKQLEEFGAGNGVIINYETVPPEQIRPPQLPQAIVDLEQSATAEMKQVTNIHDELLGQTTQKTVSGTAINARQRGGLLTHEGLFDSFRLEKQARTHFLIGLVKQFISPTKALRILGTLAQRGNQQFDQMLGQAATNPVAAQDVLTLLSDAFVADYDVVISSKPTEPSLAMQAWEALSDLKQKGAEIPPKTLWEAAEKAGILSQAQVQDILEFIQQNQQHMMQGAPPGQPPPPGLPPPPGAAPGPPTPP